jgi:hypothetical protein
MTPETFQQQYAAFKAEAAADGRFIVEDIDTRAYIHDDTLCTSYDDHYLYHTTWAAHRIYKNRPAQHTDISSFTYFSAFLSSFVPTVFLDYRPINVTIDNYRTGQADITNLAISGNSIESLSCMHVVEHIGLGRYGEPISATGDKIAAEELKRVLAPGGTLYMVLPVASENRVYFNAHKVYTFDCIMKMFGGLILCENALLCDYPGAFIKNADKSVFDKQKYGCGCFEFRKPM